MKVRLISWNINGIRAACKKGFLDFLNQEQADIVCVQEVKAQMDQLENEIAAIPGYQFYLAEAERKGYSGVGIYSKLYPKKVTIGLKNDTYNSEGRVIRLDFEDFILYNIYFPNGASGSERQKYKMGFNYCLLDELKELLKEGKKIVICGDVNIAHEPIDLKNPLANEKHSGFLPEERRFLDDLLDAGFIDTYRYVNPEAKKYSWWSYRFNARATNAGWRIDYFFVSENLKENIIGAEIFDQIQGSDHAPIELILDF